MHGREASEAARAKPGHQEEHVEGGVLVLQVTAVLIEADDGGNGDLDGEIWLARSTCGVR